ncbi:MAG: hypothetical protein R3D69_08080 [Xanthobacteraceae bacterium]
MSDFLLGPWGAELFTWIASHPAEVISFGLFVYALTDALRKLDTELAE